MKPLKSFHLLWLTFCLSDRTHTIILGDSRKPWVPVLLGVPQRSLLSPLILVLYKLKPDTPSPFPSYSASGHLSADDVHGPPSQLDLASKIDDLPHELHL